MARHRAVKEDRPVAAYYDRLAPVYGDGEYSRARRAAVLAAIAAELEAAKDLCDLGCGNGAFLPALAPPGGRRRVLGIDLSVKMLSAARERATGPVHFVRGDASALPCRAGVFDLVFMSHVLLLVSDLDACLAGVARALRPGGVLIATVGASGWPEIVDRLLGPERIREFQELFDTASVDVRQDEPSAVAEACRRSGLPPSWRQADFAVSWPVLEEWVRIRWFSIMSEPARQRAEEWVAGIRPPAGAAFRMAETLLVAHHR